MKERLVELLRAIDKDATITCPRYSSESTLADCKGCQYDKEDGSCDYAEREADYLLENGVIVPPCKVGDVVYFYKAEINEICPAKVIKITNNYYMPSMPLWITIEYESKLIGRQSCEMASDVFKLLCHTKKEQAEAKLKGSGK